MWPFPLVLLRKRRQNVPKINNYSGFRTRKAQVRKCNRFPRQKGGHGPRRSMRRPRKLGKRTRHCSLVTELGVLGRKFWQVSRLIRSSRIQRCRSFSERVGPRVIILKASQVSSCSKRSLEITTLIESIAVLVQRRKWSPTANDPQTGNDPQIGPQMIPNRKSSPMSVEHKWSPQENKEWHG